VDDLNITGLSPFQILREDLSSMRQEFNSAIRSLVTSDLFRDEQRRVDDKFQGLGREISDLRKEFDTAMAALTLSEQTRLKAEIAQAQERDKLRRQLGWQWIALIGAPIITFLIGRLLA
jgi:hypothetical protein